MIRRARNGWLRTNVLAGGALLVAFVLMLAVAFTITKRVPFRHYDYVKAAFSDAGSLRVGDDVREHSVRVGQVSAIDVGSGHAVVTMQLPSGSRVHQDAAAVIRARSALGQAYVDLAPGASRSLGDATIGTEHTLSQQQLDTLLDVFDGPTRTAASSATRALGGGAAGHGQDLQQFIATGPQTLGDLASVSQALSSDTADLPSTLQAANLLAQHFTGSTQQLAGLLQHSQQVLAAFGVDGTAPLNQTLEKLPVTLAAVRSATDALQQPLQDGTAAVAALRPGLAALGAQADDLSATLTSGTASLAKVPAVAQQAVPALTSLTRTSSDLRPLAAPLSQTFTRLQPTLGFLAPYAPNASLWFAWFANALSQALPNGGHYLRLDLVTGPAAVTGVLPAPAALTPRDPYPGPAQAYSESGR
jgi:phospholipid/cholesterol/gamma-HCH transport system substrate-binding protein